MASDIASSLRVWPVGGGETGALIRTRDWSATPLGNIGQWPERLRAAVDNCLDAAFASFVWWGPDLVQLYNDPALAIVQAKHPAAFGVPAREAWPEVWAAVGPVVERVMSTGRPVLGGDMLLAPDRGGRHGPACISFSYSALRGGAGVVAGMLVTASEMTERVHGEPAQRDHTLFEAMDEGYLLVDVIFDEAGRAVDIEYVEANPAAIRMVGDDMTGRRVSESGVDYEPYWYEVWGRVARTGKGERLERYAAPLKRWFDFFVFKPAPSDHEGRRVAVVFQDVTARRNAEIAERARAEAALHESAEQFRQFGDASCDVLWIRDAKTLQWEHLSPAFETIFGKTREDVLKGDNLANWADLIVSEDRERALASIGRVRSGEHVTFEYRIKRPSDGEIRWLRNTDFPLVDEAGRVLRIGGISHDVTGERAAAERVVVMVAELQHRTRNLIAVVRSIISHTLASSPSPDGFKLRIDDRLSALSRVQGLLSRSEQEPITIGALVQLELDALGRDVQRERIDIAGPEVRLPSSIVQTLALALHELAINARKYGALSTDQARLQIAWQLEQRDKAAWLVLSWVEENTRRADAPPGHKGFGRELIEDALPYSHGAETRYELDEMGLRCSIALPLGTDGRQERLS